MALNLYWWIANRIIYTLKWNLAAGKNILTVIRVGSWTMLSCTQLTLGSHLDPNNSITQTLNLKLTSNSSYDTSMDSLFQYDHHEFSSVGLKNFHFSSSSVACTCSRLTQSHGKSKIFMEAILDPNSYLGVWWMTDAPILSHHMRQPNTMSLMSLGKNTILFEGLFFLTLKILKFN